MAILTEKWYIQFWNGFGRLNPALTEKIENPSNHIRLTLEDCPNQKYFVISKNNQPYPGLYCGMTNQVSFHTFADVWQFHAKSSWKDVVERLLKAANLPEEWDDSILKNKHVLVIDENGKIVDNAE